MHLEPGAYNERRMAIGLELTKYLEGGCQMRLSISFQSGTDHDGRATKEQNSFLSLILRPSEITLVTGRDSL